MKERWMRFAPFAYGLVWACVPLFPSFIALTSVQFPGVSVVPLPMALVVLGLMVVLGLWGAPTFFTQPAGEQPVARAIFIFVGFAFVSALIGFNPRDGAAFIAIMALGGLWHLGQMRDYERGGVARAIYWSFLTSGIISCLLALGMVITRIPAAQYAVANGRAVGTFVLPGELAGYLIVLVSVACGLALAAHSRALRGTAWIAALLGVVTMAMSFSRTGYIGLGCAAAFFVAMRAGGRKRGWVAASTIIAMSFALVLAFFNERHNPSENFTRISIWQAAVGVIERFPLTGVGPFGFSRMYPKVRMPGGDETAFHAHSMYLTFLAELGIIGFAAFVWVLWSFFAELRTRLRGASAPATTLALAIAAGVVGTLVQGLIDTVSVVIFGLLFPTLALALGAARAGSVDA